jgi:hypothetical protein
MWFELSFGVDNIILWWFFAQCDFLVIENPRWPPWQYIAFKSTQLENK